MVYDIILNKIKRIYTSCFSGTIITLEIEVKQTKIL